MEVVTLCPLRASAFEWISHSGAHALTVIVKATFSLEPEESPLAKDQQPIHATDVSWSDNPARSVAAPSDRVPFKPGADVVLVGHAYAPGGQPVRSMAARLAVSTVDKTIEVWCDRAFRAQDGQLVEGPRFTKMTMWWERAAADPDGTNPVGMRFDAPPDASGMIPLPNLQPPGIAVTKRSDTWKPVSFAPLSPWWPERTRWLGGAAASFAQKGWEERPLPEGLSPEYFQAAPPDQVARQIRPNERIVLENLHPDHARFVTRLPGISPAVLVERAAGGREKLQLVADTLWIDTDRAVCAVVWRGRIGLYHSQEAGRITVTMEGGEHDEHTLIPATADKPRSFDAPDADDPAVSTITPGWKPSAPSVLPFAQGPRPVAAPSPASPPLSGGLPFAPSRSPSTSMPALVMAPTFGPPPVPASAPPVPVSAPPVLALAPAPVRVPAPVATPKAAEGSPWAAPPNPIQGASPPAPPVVATPRIAPSRPSIGASAAAAVAASAATSTDRAAQEGAAAASTAAAGVAPWSLPAREVRRPVEEPVEAPRPEPAAPLLQLLWYDADSMARIRRVPAWKEAIASFERAPRSREIELVDGARDPWEIDDRAEVLQILAKAPRADGHGIEEAFERAVGDDGKLSPPLVLVAAEMELPFDELETLKAAMSTASPLVTPPDEGLRSAVQCAKDFVQTPGLSAAPAVCEGLTRRIREAFVKEKTMPPDYLDAQVDRVLLTGRHHQKRTVLGGKHLRCLLWPPGEEQAVVGYLPEEVGSKLPMWKRFPARLIVEVHPAQDQHETPEHAVKVLAVARAGAARAKG